ncbi:MAG: hypothetical protein ACOX5W_13610 [Bacillota bacterium]|jgi:uncharacterized membrane protein
MSKKHITLTVFLLVFLLSIPVITNAQDDSKNLLSSRSMLDSYQFSGLLSNNIYSQDTFNTNGTNILLNYRQWDNVPQCIQTVRYVICNHGYIYDTDYVYNTSDVDDENQAYQMYLGAPPAGTDRSLKIINETRVYPISGFGELYE